MCEILGRHCNFIKCDSNKVRLNAVLQVLLDKHHFMKMVQITILEYTKYIDEVIAEQPGDRIDILFDNDTVAGCKYFSRVLLSY